MGDVEPEVPTTDVGKKAPVVFKWWQHLLAAFLAFHIIGAVLMSAPSPEGSLRKSAWAEPTAQAEFHAWAEGVRSLGVEVTDKEFEDFLWEVGKEYVDIKRTILTPYKKYAHHSGARQGWRMFVAPHRNPSTLNIDIEERGDDGKHTWRNVYGSEDGLMGPDRSHKGQWRAHQFRHNRVAKTVFLSGWRFRRNRYREFSHWIAETAAKDFPEATRVRVRLYRFKTLTPDEVRAGEKEVGRFHNSKTFDLGRIRARHARDKALLEKILEEDPEERRALEKESEARLVARKYRDDVKREKRRKKKEAREQRRAKKEEQSRQQPNADPTSATKPPIPPMPIAEPKGDK